MWICTLFLKHNMNTNTVNIMQVININMSVDCRLFEKEEKNRQINSRR